MSGLCVIDLTLLIFLLVRSSIALFQLLVEFHSHVLQKLVSSLNHYFAGDWAEGSAEEQDEGAGHTRGQLSPGR